MTKLRAIPSLFVFAAAFAVFVSDVQGQDRPRVARPILSQPVNQPAPPADNTRTTLSSQPTNNPARQPLTNEIKVSEEYKQQLVKKTADSRPVSAMLPALVKASRYAASTTAAMVNSIQSKLGIPYRYGSSGPNRYDCSGFVWAVFSESGMGYERQSAAGLWNTSTPVDGDEKYRFGTLVFFNGLGHIGIVADANGFYHASSSKGITYSPFNGYWGKRIVGFRKFDPRVAAAETTETK